MPPVYRKSLFIFRRDLRLEDNTGLRAAMQASSAVVPCFIFDPRQVGDQPYRGQPAVDFMLDSLWDLKGQIARAGGTLFLLEGKAHEVVARLIREEGLDAVYVNSDYTPFSRSRDQAIALACQQGNAAFHTYHDAMLHAPDVVKKDDGGVYTVYTPFCRKAMTIPVARPEPVPPARFYNEAVPAATAVLPRQTTHVDGGRAHGLALLARAGGLSRYAAERDVPALDATTRLSPHHKFGTCSIREVYWHIRTHLGEGHTLIKELFWRDFFMYIGYHFPRVVGSCFDQRYERLPWVNNTRAFELWCQGKTGFPIVDAGMRELNATGFMHNRVRMITACFLVKDLHIDWRWGERYFATRLVDYDPLVNNGNWQWAASTGCDAQPYFRIFNPWLQQQKFDPQARYIKRWVPELAAADPKDIHQIFKKELQLTDYPRPMVWHDAERAASLKAYRQCL